MERNDVQRIVVVLGIYFLLQLVIRLLISPDLELDEAEQLLLTQQLSLGYGSQPPLYTWLLSGLFSLFGVTIFSLALLKNVLLFTTYLLTYHAARALGYSRTLSVAAMLSLFLLPQIVWESQRDLTHSVLAVTLTAASIVVWLRLKREPSLVNYLLTGGCWGAALLGKYNVGIFLVSLMLASLTIVEYRRLILCRRFLYTIGMLAAVIAPHVVWAATHVPALMSSSTKFKQAAHKSYVVSVLNGTASLVMAIVSFAGPLIVVYGLLWYRQRRRQAETAVASSIEQSPGLLLRTILVAFCICLVMVLVFQVTVFKDRWMQPILFFLPLALMPFAGDVLAQRKARVIRVLAGCVACLVLLGMAFRAQLVPILGIPLTRFNLPYRALVSQLRPQLVSADMVVTHHVLIAGAIRLQYPQLRVTVPGGARLYHEQRPGRILVVWQEEQRGKPLDGLWLLVAAMMGEQRQVISYNTVYAPYHYLTGKTMSLSSALIQRAVSSPAQ